MLSSAPVALRCTRMSFDLARRVRGTRAPDFAIFVLLSSKGRAADELGPWTGNNVVPTVSCKVSHATDCVALHFNVGTEHLPDKWFEAPELDDEEFIVGWSDIVKETDHDSKEL